MLDIFQKIITSKIAKHIFFVFFLAVLMASPFLMNAVECTVDESDESADETEYCLLEPIFSDQADKGVTLSSYLGKAYQAFFITAGLLATLMLIVGGFQYMISESGGNKSKAKDQMWNAVWGLLLALSSYLILYTINPGLVETNFKLEVKPIPIQTSAGGVVEGGDTPTPGAGQPWPDDSAVRAA
ncbi:MAG: pilin, partial [Patescibacteria group bacterium]